MEKDDTMVMSSFVTEDVAEVSLESDIFCLGYRFFVVVDDRKGHVTIDGIGGSDGSFIRILWWIDKLDCRRC